MKGYLGELRPSERRLVVGIAAVMFVVLNLWFVVPHFSDWGRVQTRMKNARLTLSAFQTKIANVPTLQRMIKVLEGEGALVPIEDQAMHFSSVIQEQAVKTGVNIISTGKIVTRTNDPFFLEQSQQITLLAKEQQLVDFLYNLGESNSLIRVRDLGLRPDAPRQSLSATVKLVASFQKKPPPKSAAAPRANPKPADTAPKSVKPITPAGGPGTTNRTPTGPRIPVPTPSKGNNPNTIPNPKKT